jgi:hypothetical protein
LFFHNSQYGFQKYTLKYVFRFFFTDTTEISHFIINFSLKKLIFFIKWKTGVTSLWRIFTWILICIFKLVVHFYLFMTPEIKWFLAVHQKIIIQLLFIFITDDLVPVHYGSCPFGQINRIWKYDMHFNNNKAMITHLCGCIRGYLSKI